MEITPTISKAPGKDIILYPGILQTPEIEIIETIKTTPFIEANTKDVSLSCLQQDCVIPVFAKDNEKTIAHQEFIEVTNDCINSVFSQHQIEKPEIRVSHQIKGRTPDAIHKSAKDLLDFEKTQYFERMAFIIRVPSITHTLDGNQLSLMVGGVRAYNRENLYSKKSFEKFQVFIGFQNMVCCNLCVSTDGYSSELKVSSISELREKIMALINSYQLDRHIQMMKNLTQQSITETQFAQLIGRMKLYQYLSKSERAGIPSLLINDSQISSIAKDYYQDERFCRNEDGNINLWDVYNLFTSANKSSYIDGFVNRSANAFDFTNDLCTKSNNWFLN